MKHGSIMLWGYFSSVGAKKLVVDLGNMNRANYRKILGGKKLTGFESGLVVHIRAGL